MEISKRNNGIHTYGGRTLIATSVIFQCLALLAVVLRVRAAFVVSRKFQAHDYLIFAAIVCSLGYFAICIAGVTVGGLGLHVVEDSPESLVSMLKIFYSSFYVWITATMFVKLSILSLYVTVFVTPWFRRVAWGIAIVTFMFWASYILVAIAICRPIRKNWLPETPGECGSSLGQEIASAAINMILDLSIAVAPIPILWNMQLSTEKKAYLTGVITAGIIICAMNATRIGIEATTASSKDFTYTNPQIALFAGLETWIGIIVACIPLLGPIFLTGRTGLTDVKPRPNFYRRSLYYLSSTLFGSQSGSGSDSAEEVSDHSSDRTARQKKRSTRKGGKLFSIRGKEEALALASFDDTALQKGDAGQPANWASAGTGSSSTLRAAGSVDLPADSINVRTDLHVSREMV